MARLIPAAVAVYLTVLLTALPSAQTQQDGKSIFRFDTFGSEQLWTGVLQMQHVIAQKVSPNTALSVGLKVDVDALPPSVIDALEAGQVNLDDPAVTVQLLKLNAASRSIPERSSRCLLPSTTRLRITVGARANTIRAFTPSKAGCARCHRPPLFTDVASGPDPTVPLLHETSEIPTNDDYAERSATKKWRTTPIRALWQHPPYFHDESAADLLDVVNRYNDDPRFALGLTDRQKADLVEFLKTL